MKKSKPNPKANKSILWFTYGVVALFIGMNLLTLFTYTVTSNVIIFTNSIRLVFLAFFLLVDIVVLILRKIR